MNKRYKELVDIITKFPFLKDTVADNIKEVYTDAEFLNYKNFVKEYDHETDLFGLSSNAPKYLRGSYYYTYGTSDENSLACPNKEDILLYNLISSRDTASIYAKNYPILIEICNILIDNLHVDESWFTTSASTFSAYSSDSENLTDEDKLHKRIIKTIGYLASEFAFDNAFIEYIKKTDETGKSLFIKDILEETSTAKQFNKLCKTLNLHSRNIFNDYYVTSKNTAFHAIEAAVTKVYDSYPLEDIELFKRKAKLFNDIFAYFNIEYDRAASLLNNHISDDARNELTKNFTSANDIATLTKNVVSSFSTEKSFDGEKINLIISNVIVGNRKIRDRDFPETKDKVVHEFFRLLFIGNSYANNFNSNENYTNEINKVIDNNYDYLLDPYFMSALLMKESVLNDHYTDMVKNTKRFVSLVLNTSKRINIFINKYIAELQKPQSERVSTVKSVKSDVISYGVLYHILSKYAVGNVEYSGVEEDGSVNPVKLLLLAYGKHHEDIKKHILEDTGNIKESSRYYYGDDYKTNLSKIISSVLSSRSSEYLKELIGCDGVPRTVSAMEQKYHGSFNHIMSYLTESDSDFDYNENLAIGVREGSRWSRSSEKESVPKKFYDYIRESIKLVLIQLYRHIVNDYGSVLKPEQLEEVKSFITQKDNTINILPDTVFAVATRDKNNALNKEYASDVSDYGCLNYLILPTLCIYLLSMRDNNSLFKFNILEDTVFLPELDTKYYENKSRGVVNSRVNKSLELFNSMTVEELEFFKPVLFTNFSDEFSFTRTMQVCLFANMLNSHDSVNYQYGSYNDYLLDSYALQSDVSRASSARAIDYTQVFFIHVLYPKLLANNLITSDEMHTVEDSFNKAYTDYDCLLSLR